MLYKNILNIPSNYEYNNFSPKQEIKELSILYIVIAINNKKKTRKVVIHILGKFYKIRKLNSEYHPSILWYEDIQIYIIYSHRKIPRIEQ